MTCVEKQEAFVCIFSASSEAEYTDTQTAGAFCLALCLNLDFFFFKFYFITHLNSGIFILNLFFVYNLLDYKHIIVFPP